MENQIVKLTAYRLPKIKREPYRLWFEFLKLSIKDTTVAVESQIYSEWGDIENSDFDVWWKSHWKQLFSEPVSSGKLFTAQECREALNDQSCVVIRLSLHETNAQRTSFIKSVLADASGLLSLKPIKRSKFNLTANRSMNLTNLRIMLKLYEFWLDSSGDLNLACRRYYDWATLWNSQIDAKKWGRRKVPMPPSLRQYIDCLNNIADNRLTLSASNRLSKAASSHSYDALRADMRRYIRRAQKIALNTGRGVFPGEY